MRCLLQGFLNAVCHFLNCFLRRRPRPLDLHHHGFERKRRVFVTPELDKSGDTKNDG